MKNGVNQNHVGIERIDTGRKNHVRSPSVSRNFTQASPPIQPQPATELQQQRPGKLADTMPADAFVAGRFAREFKFWKVGDALRVQVHFVAVLRWQPLD